MTPDHTTEVPQRAVHLPPVRRSADDPTRAFTGIAALGGVFAGWISYDRNPDLLATGIAAGATFLGALLALWALFIVFRVTMVCVRIAVPVALVLTIGCALDWPWAKSTVRGLLKVASQTVAVAERGWEALRAS